MHVPPSTKVESETDSISINMENNAIADNSINTAHFVILDALRGAGELGLSLDDLVDAIGATGQNKLVLKRLQDLENRNKVTTLPNNSWIIKEAHETAPVETPSKDGSGVKTCVISLWIYQGIITSGEGLTLCDNSLQEYCQKRKAAVPAYQQQRTAAGILGKVSFLNFTFEGETATDNSKDADQRAAFASLKGLGYLPKDAKYDPSIFGVAGTKRNSTSGMEGNTPSKQVCFGITAQKTSKSALNELAQKNKLSQPTYDVVQTPNGFFCTVTFNGRHFKSSKSCSKKKDAEQNAADVALAFLTNSNTNGVQDESETAADIDDMIKTARVASNVMKYSYKNRLQEYCQRLKKPLPTYETERDSTGTFTSKVTVEENTYTGKPSTGKKEAEKSAAEAALIVLGLMAVEEKSEQEWGV